MLLRYSATTAHRLKPLSISLWLALPVALSATCALAADETDKPSTIASTQADSDAPRLEQVTVTARRRAEESQDVPTPITTLSGAQLESQRIYKIQDLQQALPSVNVAYTHARVSSFAVRGIGNNPASDGLEGSAGIYLDNVYLGRPGMAAFDMMDIEQLELLRGPQGTLFGKNTTAGVLNIATRGPTFTPERSVQVSGGQDGYFQGKGSFSGPITDTLAGRVSFYRTRDDGYLNNRYDGRTLLGGEREGIRGQLLFKPNEDFSLRWINEYNSENSSSGSSVIYGAGPVFWKRAELVGAHPELGKSNIDGRQNVSVHQNASSVEANWNLAGGYTLTSISAYRSWHFNPANDADQLDVPVIKDYGFEVHDRQFSQEIRLASPKGDFFDYVVGAYAFKQNLGNRIFTDFGPLADLDLIGANLNALNNINSKVNGKVNTESYALFAQGTWHLSDRLDFSAGIRGTYEEKEANVQRFAPTGGGPAVVIPGVVDGNAVRAGQVGAYDSGNLHMHNAAPSFLASVSYHFDDDVLGYASLSHGEKSGGVNLAVASAPSAGAESLLVGPERANDAELGVKSQLFDHRLQLNANVFWTGVNGYQATTYYQPPGALTGYQLLTNAGSVRSRGVELEATAVPVRGLTVNVNGSFNDVTYLSFKNAPCPAEVVGATTCDLTGKPVAGASRWIGNVNGEYKWPRVNGVEPYATGSYAYRSESEGTLDNSDLSKINGYGLANFSVGARVGYGDGLLDASLWVKNAFDKEYYLAVGNGINGLYTASPGQPRTAGVTVRYDF